MNAVSYQRNNVTTQVGCRHLVWTMLAHYHGQVWNAAEPARSLGVNESTVRRYLDLLDGVFMVRQLRPWHENLKKRQVRSSHRKYSCATAACYTELLGIRTANDLYSHPKYGASWEGYVMEEILAMAAPDEAYFWATHAGAELDLLLFQHGARVGIEIKRVDAPKITPSMRIALDDLGLERLLVVYPGDKRYWLAERIEAVPFAALIRAPRGGGGSLVV